MTAKQESRYDMMEQVEKCLDANFSIIDSIPAIRRNVNRYRQQRPTKPPALS